MERDDLARDGREQLLERALVQVRYSRPQHSQRSQVLQHPVHKIPRAASQVEPPELRPLAQELRDGLEEADVVVVADHDEAELLEVGQERVHAVDDVVAAEHDARAARLLERAVEGERLEAVRVRDAREHDVRDARVDELELRQVPDRRRLERVVPRVVSLQVRSQREMAEGRLVLVEDCAHFTHVGESVVVFSTQEIGRAHV